MGKVAVITGATKGIGRAIANAFAEEGFDVAICARHRQELETAKQVIEKTYAISCHVFKADLSNKNEVIDFADFVKSLEKEIVALVNNTGVFIPGKIAEEGEGALEKMLETNLYSAYHLTRQLLPKMRENKSGHIFNMCSTASIMAYPNGGSYCISKFALYGMTKVLREELKHEYIRVTAILPGATFTSSWEGVELPEERFMKATDVAAAVLGAFKLSKQAVVEEIIIRPQLGDL